MLLTHAATRPAAAAVPSAADEVIGRHISMLMPPEFVEDMPKILGRVAGGERIDTERGPGQIEVRQRRQHLDGHPAIAAQQLHGAFGHQR